METSYLNTDMCKFESSQSNESRASRLIPRKLTANIILLIVVVFQQVVGYYTMCSQMSLCIWSIVAKTSEQKHLRKYIKNTLLRASQKGESWAHSDDSSEVCSKLRTLNSSGFPVSRRLLHNVFTDVTVYLICCCCSENIWTKAS